MNIILFDPEAVRGHLLPLTYTRPVADLRVGILTLAQKWQKRIEASSFCFRTEEYLSELFPSTADPDSSQTISIAGNVIADDDLCAAITNLQPGQALCDPAGTTIAVRGRETERIVYQSPYKAINRPTDIFLLNGREISVDFKLLTHGRQSAPLSSTVTVIGNKSDIFLEENAVAECCSINVKDGPVYIGANAEIMEGATLRGPIALGEHSVINMGAKIYGSTTIGPWSRVGGELNNVVIHSYSNKAHDGFLGNAVIGSWCNLGAGCTASNLKNDYTEIKLWDYPTHRFMRTGLQFCGLIMADHSKAGINTMFNTATVVGVGVNIHGTGFPRNFVPSFQEGGAAGYSEVPMAKFFDVAERVMARRGVSLSEADRKMFQAIRLAAQEYSN